MPATYTPLLSGQGSDFEDNGLLIQQRRLVCDSCSSGQRFACGFLQIPPRGGHPCRPANSSSCQACRGLSPPSERALPGAPKEKPTLFRLAQIPHSPHLHQGGLDLLLVSEAHGQEVAVGAMGTGVLVEDMVLDLLGHQAEFLQILPQLLSSSC